MKLLEKTLMKKLFALIILLTVAGTIVPIPFSYAQTALTTPPPLAIITTTTPQLIANEASLFTSGNEVKVIGSLNGNVFSNPDKRYVLFTVNNKGIPQTVKAYTGNLYVDSSKPAVNIPIYTTSFAVESTIMDGIRQETNSGFASISGLVKKVNMQGGYSYYAFEVNNVVLNPPHQ